MKNKIQQDKILLNNSKKNSEKLKQKINELEKREKELNYKLIESNQKIKNLLNNINDLNSKQNINMNNNPNEQIGKLKEIISEKEIQISKLNLDKNNLQKKITEIKQSFEIEKKQLLDYKNSQMNTFKNLLNKQQSNSALNNVQM